MSMKKSELILNPDGSVYHLNLKPEHIAANIIFVGDQYRVDKISKHFDTIEFTTQKREFKTTTGTYKNKQFSIISTGIGPDNIDIVMNELDALVNIDLQTRKPKEKLTSLNIVRIGTSGSLQADIPVDSYIISSHALDLNGMLHSYQIEEIANPEIEKAFVKHTNWSAKRAAPILIGNHKELEHKFISEFQENQNIVHKVCRIYTSDQESHNDLFQEITIQLWKAYPKFRGDAKFSTWMYRVAFNTAISLYRKSKRNVETTQIYDNLKELEYQDYDDSTDKQLKLLYQAIYSLNDIEKALALMYLEDKSYREISKTLGISEVNARVKMNRTKTKLKNILNP